MRAPPSGMGSYPSLESPREFPHPSILWADSYRRAVCWPAGLWSPELWQIYFYYLPVAYLVYPSIAAHAGEGTLLKKVRTKPKWSWGKWRDDLYQRLAVLFFFIKEPISKRFWLPRPYGLCCSCLALLIMAPKQPQSVCEGVSMAVFQ